jgi:hypothetical protein
VCKVRIRIPTDTDKNALLKNYSRCIAPANDLDSGRHMRRSQAHAELVVEQFELGVVWDQWGIVGDIAVCLPQYPLSVGL